MYRKNSQSYATLHFFNPPMWKILVYAKFRKAGADTIGVARVMGHVRSTQGDHLKRGNIFDLNKIFVVS